MSENIALIMHAHRFIIRRAISWDEIFFVATQKDKCIPCEMTTPLKSFTLKYLPTCDSFIFNNGSRNIGWKRGGELFLSVMHLQCVYLMNVTIEYRTKRCGMHLALVKWIHFTDSKSNYRCSWHSHVSNFEMLEIYAVSFSSCPCLYFNFSIYSRAPHTPSSVMSWIFRLYIKRLFHPWIHNVSQLD